MSYEILEHTADAKFRAEGETLEEAFKEAVKAFSEIVEKDARGEIRHEVKVEAENYEALLYDFLNQLIFLQDTNNVIVCSANELEIEDTDKGHQLEAEIMVDKIDPGSSPLDLKAPTYNEMKIDHEKGKGWILEAVIDI